MRIRSLAILFAVSLGLGVLLYPGRELCAQALWPENVPANRPGLGVSLGWQNAFTLGLSYNHRFLFGLSNRPYTDLQVQFRVPIGSIGKSANYELLVSASGPLLREERFALLGQFGFSYLGGDAPTGKTQSISAWGGLAPGVFQGSNFFGLWLGMQQGIASHLRIKPGVQDTFGDRYPNQVGSDMKHRKWSGWLWFPNTAFEVGALASLRFGERFGLNSRIAWYAIPNRLGLLSNGTLGWLPFTADIQAVYWLP